MSGCWVCAPSLPVERRRYSARTRWKTSRSSKSRRALLPRLPAHVGRHVRVAQQDGDGGGKLRHIAQGNEPPVAPMFHRLAAAANVRDDARDAHRRRLHGRAGKALAMRRQHKDVHERIEIRHVIAHAGEDARLREAELASDGRRQRVALLPHPGADDEEAGVGHVAPAPAVPRPETRECPSPQPDGPRSRPPAGRAEAELGAFACEDVRIDESPGRTASDRCRCRAGAACPRGRCPPPPPCRCPPHSATGSRPSRRPRSARSRYRTRRQAGDMPSWK